MLVSPLDGLRVLIKLTLLGLSVFAPVTQLSQIMAIMCGCTFVWRQSCLMAVTGQLFLMKCL